MLFLATQNFDRIPDDLDKDAEYVLGMGLNMFCARQVHPNIVLKEN